MGTELGICHFPDLTSEFLQDDSLATTREFLFPFALQIPDWNHIVDGCFAAGLRAAATWPIFFETFSGLCQFTHLKVNRDALKGNAPGDKRKQKNLSGHIKSIVKHRWGYVATNLRRIHARLPDYSSVFRYGQWSSTTRGLDAMKKACSSPAFKRQLKNFEKYARICDDC